MEDFRSGNVRLYYYPPWDSEYRHNKCYGVGLIIKDFLEYLDDSDGLIEKQVCIYINGNQDNPKRIYIKNDKDIFTFVSVFSDYIYIEQKLVTTYSKELGRSEVIMIDSITNIKLIGA